MDESNNQITDEVKTASFSEEIDVFIQNLNSLNDIFPLVIELVGAKLIQESRAVDKFIDSKSIKEENSESNGSTKLQIPAEDINQFIKLIEIQNKSGIAYNFLPINFIVSFVSQYDAYLGCLIRTMFLIKPEILNSSEKNILFSELLEFNTLDEARDFIIEKEVESVLRESHLKQFKWLEGKLNIKLREDLPSFKDFIEITERRNLFMHCNGVVSRQYIETCKENLVPDIDKIKVGDKLNVKPAYFTKCYVVLFEIGVKLGHVLWRKLQPNNLEDADKHLNNICYELILRKHYRLAQNILAFATETLKRHFDQEVFCTLIINKALAYYLSNKIEECNSVIAKHDWSATSDKFKLAVSVLEEDYSKSITLMKNIGPSNSHLNKEAYKEWPLFSKFRQTDEFKVTYKSIFGEEIVYIEPKPKSLEDFLSEWKDLKKEIDNEEIMSQQTE